MNRFNKHKKDEVIEIPKFIPYHSEISEEKAYYRLTSGKCFRVTGELEFQLLNDKGNWEKNDELRANFFNSPKNYIEVSEAEALKEIEKLRKKATSKTDYINFLSETYQRHFYINNDGLIVDSLCDNIAFKEMAAQVEKEVRQQMEKNHQLMGTCHSVWKLKKEIFKNKYGIEWLSPAELNPTVNFD